MMDAFPPMTRRKYLELLRTQMSNDRSSWESHWQELADFITPRRIRLSQSDTNQGTKKNNRIINNTATLAARTLRSGMMAGVTSPARRWFKLGLEDKDLEDFYAVKLWLHDVTDRMNAVMNSSNLYNALPMGYSDLGVFGTSAIFVLEDPRMVLNAGTLPVGSYWASHNISGFVDVVMRECTMKVRNIVERFVRKNEKSGSFDWSSVSARVKSLWDSGQHEHNIEVYHAVYPNEDYDPYKIDGQFKRYASVYYEKDSDGDKLLSQSGYDEFPIMVPRWDLTGNDVYGSSPGMDALGDIRALQILEKRKAQAVEKTVNPPMTAPTSLRNQKASILPGDITFVDVRDGQDGFKPAHEIRFSIKEMVLDIENHQNRIRRAFYEDLFLMLAMSDRREITAREVQERHEEKLLALGPVITRLNSDLLNPLIDRTFEIMVRAGKIPPPPPELEPGTQLKVEYISMMAQAQKLVSLGSTERFATFVGNIAAGPYPEANDKVNWDEMIEEHGEMMGVSPRVIRPKDATDAIRNDRAARVAAQERAAQIETLTKAARNLGSTPVNEDTALNRVAQNADRVL
jgi:hypothetical protein